MGSPVLLLRLEGPLQSWGGRSRWDVRDTESEPTKSGVIGLLGAAFGYERGNPELVALDRHLRFGVRVEARGRILKDYQTVTGVLRTAEGKLRGSEDDPTTILSPRYYIEDGAFLVGLEAVADAPEGLLPRCESALRRPAWSLFLGRKTCVPSRPIFDRLTDDYGGLEAALRCHQWEWQGVRGIADGRDERGRASRRPPTEQELGAWRLPIYIEDRENTEVVLRQDALRQNASRYYDFLPVRNINTETRATVALAAAARRPSHEDTP